MGEYYLVLGSNLGERINNLADAVEKLKDKYEIDAKSSLYETKPYGYLDQDKFINASVRLTGKLDLHELLKSVKTIEKEIGRTSSPRWGPRVIDLDIALAGEEVVHDHDLLIPHPGLFVRDFFIEPILEIDPEVQVPGGRFLKEIAGEITRDKKTIRRVFDDHKWKSI